MNEPFKPVETHRARTMSAGEAIRYHYDNDTDFFALWLDPSLSYSAARWREPVTGTSLGATLEEAQTAKLDFHLTAARVGQGERLLDIGCGWGGVLRRATAVFGACRALGLTLSEHQFDYIASQCWPNVSVLLEDAFAFESDETFDAAISIGAFEHFAKPGLAPAEKRARYETFFERVACLLEPAARFSLQTIVWDSVDPASRAKILPETVFPQSDLPFVDEVTTAAQRPFRLVYMENDPDEYRRTLTAWIDNLRAVQDTVIRRWGAAKYAFFERYLRDSRLGFGRHRVSLARFVFERR